MRQRYLGSKSVKLFRVVVRGQRGVLSLSSRAWLMYNYQGRYHQTPLSYEALEYAANFSSELCPEGIVAVAGNTLRIVTVENLGGVYNQVSFPLRYTPRKMCMLPDKSLVVVEADHNEFSEAERAAIAATTIAEAEQQMEVGDEEEQPAVSVPIRGPVPAADGRWGSCIRILQPSTGQTLELLELASNEAALSVCTCRFATHAAETLVIVGTAQDLQLHPRKTRSNYVHVYRLLEGRLQLLHSTEIEDVPLALCEFNGRLLVGAGKCLKLFELGKRKLLKKAENKQFPTAIVKIQCSGDRIYVGDMSESVHFARYKRQENVLGIFADDTYPR
jgi:splicing factor 3B subunit 3